MASTPDFQCLSPNMPAAGSRKSCRPVGLKNAVELAEVIAAFRGSIGENVPGSAIAVADCVGGEPLEPAWIDAKLLNPVPDRPSRRFEHQRPASAWETIAASSSLQADVCPGLLVRP